MCWLEKWYWSCEFFAFMCSPNDGKKDVQRVNSDQIPIRPSGTYKVILQYREGLEDKRLDVPIVDANAVEKWRLFHKLLGSVSEPDSKLYET